VLGGAGEDAPALAGGGPGRAAGALPEAGRQRGELQDHLPNFSQNGPHPPPPTGDEGRVCTGQSQSRPPPVWYSMTLVSNESCAASHLGEQNPRRWEAVTGGP